MDLELKKLQQEIGLTRLMILKSYQNPERWHEWFAWYPVICNIEPVTLNYTWAWMSKIYRRGEYDTWRGYSWEYRKNLFDLIR